MPQSCNMTIADYDLYFHMINHYRKIRRAKAIVDCSYPKGYKKLCECRPAPQVVIPSCASRNVRTCSSPCRSQSSPPDSIDRTECQRSCSAPTTCRRYTWKDWNNRCFRARVFNLDQAVKSYTEKRCTHRIGKTLSPLNNRVREKDNDRFNSRMRGRDNDERKKEKESPKNKMDKSAVKPRQRQLERKQEAKPPQKKEAIRSVAKTEQQAAPASKEAQEHEYVYFLLKITEDILRNNLYNEEQMENLFQSHIEANKGRLSEDRMRAQIVHLKKELNFPLALKNRCCYTAEELEEKTVECARCSQRVKKEPPDTSKEPPATSKEPLAIRKEPPGTSKSFMQPNIFAIKKEMEEEEKLKKESGKETKLEEVKPVSILVDETKEAKEESKAEETREVIEEPKRKLEIEGQVALDDAKEELKGKLRGVEKEEKERPLGVIHEMDEEKDQFKEVQEADEGRASIPSIKEELKAEEVEEPKFSEMYHKISIDEENLFATTVKEIPAQELKVTIQEPKPEREDGTKYVVKEQSEDESDENEEVALVRLEDPPEEFQNTKITFVKITFVKTPSVKKLASLLKATSVEKPSGTKSDSSCGDPATCPSKSVLPEGTSLIRIVKKDDPEHAENTLIIYTPQSDKQYSSTPLQRTALKIEVDKKEEEYVLIDGPVCIPRSMLETKTIPVLLENISSTAFVSPISEDEKQTLSQVNLLQQGERKAYGNVGSVSGQFEGPLFIKETEVDLTPEREDQVASNENKPIPKRKRESGSEQEQSISHKDQYVVVNGPVYVPRNVLETGTTPDNLENVSSLFIHSAKPPENELSHVNLFENESLILDSASLKCKGMENEMTPEREVIAETKDEEKCNDKDCWSYYYSNPELTERVDLNQLAEYKELLKDCSAPCTIASISAIYTITKTEITGCDLSDGNDGNVVKRCSTNGSPEKDRKDGKPVVIKCINSACPKNQKKQQPLEGSNIEQGTSDVKKIFSSDDPLKLSSNAEPVKEDLKISKPAVSMSEKQDAGITGPSWSAEPTKTPDIRSKEKPQIDPDHASALAQKLKQMELARQRRNSDIANKYHYLLTDVGTSMSSCELKKTPQKESGEVPVELPSRPKLPVEDKSPSISLGRRGSKSSSAAREVSPKTSPEVSPKTSPKVSPKTSPEVSPKTSREPSDKFKLLMDEKYEKPSTQKLADPSTSQLISSARLSSGSSLMKSKSLDPEKDPRIFQYSGIVMKTPSKEEDLIYPVKRHSDSLTDRLSDIESYRRPSVAVDDQVIKSLAPLLPTAEPQKEPEQQPPQSTVKNVISSTPSQKPHEGLKVRYSITRDMFEQPHQDIINKLDELPKIETDKERDKNVAAINEKMREFRKIDDDNNTRRFQISNAENFEIRRVSVMDREPDPEDEKAKQKSKNKCCGLGQQQKKKKNASITSTESQF